MLLSVVLGCNIANNGEPDCATAGVEKYRNPYDPTGYWKCIDTGLPCFQYCPVNQLYMEKEDKCIDYNAWHYTCCLDPNETYDSEFLDICALID